jgi:hypothetical protein
MIFREFCMVLQTSRGRLRGAYGCNASGSGQIGSGQINAAFRIICGSAAKKAPAANAQGIEAVSFFAMGKKDTSG